MKTDCQNQNTGIMLEVMIKNDSKQEGSEALQYENLNQSIQGWCNYQTICITLPCEEQCLKHIKWSQNEKYKH